jgi:HSP20 family protein
MTIYRTRWAAQRDLLLGGWAPVVDVNESASDVGITVELPGIDPSAVEITYENDVLTVKGEKKSTRKEGDTGTRYHIVERTFGEFTRSFRMPKGLDESKIDAQYANGVLTIRVPKAAVAAPRKIEIKTAA